MDEIEWWEFETPAEMAEQVAGDIGFVIESAIEAHGSARIAVPGGTTPGIVFDALLANKAIDWSKVTLVPTDDRLVDLDHDYSNYAKINARFASRGATVVSLVDEAALDDYREAGRLADERLGLLDWPLDLVWLGMGADGHTASIFNGPDLDRALSGPKERRAVGVHPDPMPADVPFDRVTLTGAALSSARAIMVVIQGDEKKEILEGAISDGPLSSRPVGRVLAEIDSPIDIFWSA
jgi:6-phosphogluconolactonase